VDKINKINLFAFYEATLKLNYGRYTKNIQLFLLKKKEMDAGMNDLRSCNGMSETHRL
jgi:hypothetical protein